MSNHVDPVAPQAEALQVIDPWGEIIATFREALTMIEPATDGAIK